MVQPKEVLHIHVKCSSVSPVQTVFCGHEKVFKFIPCWSLCRLGHFLRNNSFLATGWYGLEHLCIRNRAVIHSKICVSLVFYVANNCNGVYSLKISPKTLLVMKILHMSAALILMLLLELRIKIYIAPCHLWLVSFPYSAI